MVARADEPVLRASWQEVTRAEEAPRARSSHAVAVVGRTAYVFGGEAEPRVPFDNAVHAFDIEVRAWSVAGARGEAPQPRVGVAMAAVDGVIYIFAGRDAQHEELNELFSFDTAVGEWKLLSDGDASPPHRSYHALVADAAGNKLYTFGGCGKKGRLNDLWMFNIREGRWSRLAGLSPESMPVPRGGPGLAVVGGAVWALFGFNGKELADIWRFDLEKNCWHEVTVSGDVPTGRSVFGTAVVRKYIVIYGGEVDPSDQGHMGAGAFSNELFALDTETLAWRRPEVSCEGGREPGARGWYAATSYGNSMLVYGGNSDSNDRLDDMYVLSLHVE